MIPFTMLETLGSHHSFLFFFSSLDGISGDLLRDFMYAAHSEPAVAGPSDVPPTWVEQFEADLEFDEEYILEERASLVGATTCRLSDVLWSVLGLGGACMDLPFSVLCSTLRHDRHSWLYSAVDVLDILEISAVVST
ncbi:hypothetical protein AHAS_Ahas02G0195300 [Arachis hypogaea]